jgi:glycosyltransferase involved in cell wall biosynthesis
LRLAVYTDYAYRQADGAVYAERAFVKFLIEMGSSLDGLVILGRTNPEPGRSHYRLPPHVRFVALPHYSSLARAGKALAAMPRSLVRFWRTLAEVDAVWLLGPHVLAIAFALLAMLRRKPVVLGVRQDLPRYVQSRHPGRRSIRIAALVLEKAFRLLARRLPVVVVGPELARNYGRGRAVLEISVSLVAEAELARLARSERSYDGDLQVLSVGRLETEKNPLLLADVLARLRAGDERWRLVVCGEGPLERALRGRLAELGVDGHASLRGYVPVDRGLMDLYSESDLFLHVAWTEGFPQTIVEAFAARLPVVATAVGGVPDGAGGAALLVPPGDPEAAALALRRLAADSELRGRLTDKALARARSNTLEAAARNVVEFIGTHASASARPG